MRGSENNDVYVPAPPAPHESPSPRTRPTATPASVPPPHQDESPRRDARRAVEREPIVCRVAIKPTSSIPRAQRTVTRAGEPTEILVKGRHDPCLLPRFVPMGEAMMALVLVDHLFRARTSRLA